MRGRVLAVLLVLTAVTSVAFAQKPGESNIAICKHVYSEINNGSLGILDEVLADGFVEHEVLPGFPSTKEGVQAFFAAMRTAFPDLTFDVEFYVSDGDKVAAYLTINGTQKGEFNGMAATGKKISVRTVDIFQMKDGKVAEHWGVTDSMAMMEQLGAGKAE